MSTTDNRYIVVCFLLGNSPASEFIFRRFGKLFYLHRRIGTPILYTYPPTKMEKTVFRNVGI